MTHREKLKLGMFVKQSFDMAGSPGGPGAVSFSNTPYQPKPFKPVTPLTAGLAPEPASPAPTPAPTPTPALGGGGPFAVAPINTAPDPNIAKAVAAGKLTQEEADQMNVQGQAAQEAQRASGITYGSASAPAAPTPELAAPNPFDTDLTAGQAFDFQEQGYYPGSAGAPEGGGPELSPYDPKNPESPYYRDPGAGVDAGENIGLLNRLNPFGGGDTPKTTSPTTLWPRGPAAEAFERGISGGG